MGSSYERALRCTGTMVAAEQSEFGWAVVSRHDASEQDGDLEERVVLGEHTFGRPKTS